MDTRLMGLRRLALAEAIRHASLAEQAPNDDAVVETAEKFLKFLAAELNGEKARPGPLIVQPSADAASADPKE